MRPEPGWSSVGSGAPRSSSCWPRSTPATTAGPGRYLQHFGGTAGAVEALALAAGLPRDAAHSQLSAGVDVVVRLARDRSGRRRVAELGCLERDPDGLVRVDVALRVSPTGAPVRSEAAARLERLVGAVSVLGRAGVP